MTFPQTVNTVQAFGVEGDFATANARWNVPATNARLVAGPNGTIVGRFAWLDSTGTQAVNTGAGLPLGVVHRNWNAQIVQWLGQNSLTIQSGMPVAVFNGGEFWIRNSGTTSATFGMKAYANSSTGLVSFNTTGTPPTSASVTGSIAANVVTGAIAVNSMTASIAPSATGGVLTVSAVATGTVLAAGQALSGTGVAGGTVITGQLTGTAGASGTYSVNVSQTVGSTTITASGAGLTVSAVITGTLAVGQSLTGTNIPVGTVITALGTGTGGAGTYATSVSGTAASTTITASGGTLTVSAVASGAIVLNDLITGANVSPATSVTGFLTGTGGTGTYLVNVSQTAASATITVQSGVETKWYSASQEVIAPGELVLMSSHSLG